MFENFDFRGATAEAAERAEFIRYINTLLNKGE